MAPFRATLEELRKRERAALERYRDLQRKPESELGYTREESWRDVLGAREELRVFVVTIPDLQTAFAISEGNPEDAYIHEQGDPKQRGPRVRRGFLQVLGGQMVPEETNESGRLQLAQWIASPENPMTARVIVNRVWQHHFGRGLVASASDFGVRGEKPSHPELLDFLAGYLIDNGWSMKALHRLILTSRTWQLSCADVPSSSPTDPDNIYLWRGNRRRLDAEQLRDTVLLLSEQLDTSPGEAHPFPHRLTYFYRQHEPFVGDFASHRRSVYLFRQRIRKNRYLDLFDGPDGNLHLGTRPTTTTSLQSLYLLNSDFMADQSRAIAKRLLSIASAHAARIRWSYENLFGRKPSADEIQMATQQLGQLEKQRYLEADADGDVAQVAWTSMIHAMLCSNEFLFID
jgi:hypothetical protein